MKITNKRGFTLVEMMLAIAIALIIGGLFITLIVTIRSSYYRAYNDDDCADMASMYAEALENTLIYDAQNKLTDTIKIDDSNNYVLTNTLNTIDFASNPDFNQSGGRTKWVIRMVCDFDDATGELHYKFFFLDNYVQIAEGNRYLHYVYEGSFWLPSYMKFQTHTVGSGDEVTYNTETGSFDVNTWDYNYLSPDATFSISIPKNSSNITMDTKFDGNDIHTRLSNTDTGDMQVDLASGLAEFPTESSVISITGTSTVTPTPGGGGGGGGGTPTPGGGGTPTPGGGGGGTPTPGGGGGTPSAPTPHVTSGNASISGLSSWNGDTMGFNIQWPTHIQWNGSVTIDFGVPVTIIQCGNGTCTVSGTSVTFQPNEWQSGMYIQLHY